MSSLRLGDTAPDFEQESSLGRIGFHEWLGNKWAVLFSHPADFTPVCTTELGLTAKLHEQFAKRGVKVIALSVDPVEIAREVDRRHQCHAADHGKFSRHRGCGSEGERALRSHSSECQRHGDRALFVRHRSRQENTLGNHLSRQHRPQF
jgi:AhpC/TSA family